VAGTFNASQVQYANFSGENLRMKWNLLHAADLAKLSGSATLQLGPGNIRNVEKTMAQSKIAKVFLLPMRLIEEANKLASKFGAKLPATDRFAYKSIDGQYGFQAGVMTMKTFDITATNLLASVKGTIGLSGEQPIRATSQLQLAKGFVDGLGAMTLNAEIGGTLPNPQIRIDPIDTGNQILNSLGKDPEKQVENLLKGLFNKK
jgi:hypothetical protein